MENYSSTNVVQCNQGWQKKFQPSRMLGGGEILQTLHNYSTGPAVVLNEMPLRDSMISDSPLDSPMSQDSPIEKEPRPIGRKAAKAKSV
ncbi:hypothetical protein Prudu_012509 [Prunus dulcis]|uniref:Uncharacterized protein n=1 Tax=Prunus dulcis TaxID=3755 RepID=A0A4Y1RDT9_PRUDU|nr:hypothetical protein Prudu_012509 [Prunus dulcis]